MYENNVQLIIALETGENWQFISKNVVCKKNSILVTENVKNENVIEKKLKNDCEPNLIVIEHWFDPIIFIMNN